MSSAPRLCGVLLHPTALPGTPCSGTLGAASRAWIDRLGIEGVQIWQLLPLAPTDGTGSPYSSPSGSALNPWLLDADDLLSDGWISAADLARLPGGAEARLDPQQAGVRAAAMGDALLQHWDQQTPQRRQDFQVWTRQQRSWLQDHARFMVLRRLQGGQPWWQWPRPLARRERRAMAELDRLHQRELLAEALVQWQLQRQWQALRQRCKEREIGRAHV